MTRSEIALVHEGFALIAPRLDSVCLAFCGRLFAVDLSLRTLFPADLEPLVASLAAGLESVAGQLDDLRPVLTRAPALGLRLTSYGIKPTDLPVIGAAFLATLQEELGEAFTQQAHAAWRGVFWTIALAAMEAMGGKLPKAA